MTMASDKQKRKAARAAQKQGRPFHQRDGDRRRRDSGPTAKQAIELKRRMNECPGATQAPHQEE